MTSLIEKTIAIIAPFSCISCSKYNNILCEACIMSALVPLLPQCCICGAEGGKWRTCTRCRKNSGLSHVWACVEYTGLIAKVVKAYKYKRAQAAYMPLGTILAQTVPFNDWVVVPVPTSHAHVRQRGYDHAKLLAKRFAKIRRLKYADILQKNHDVRQVGASRDERQQQAQGMFTCKRNVDMIAQKVILIDDVCTTGATLSAAAQALKAAGARQVDAAVVAWQSPKS